MKQYLKAIYQSFGNPGLYARVIHRWTGSGFAYLITLSFILAIIMAAQIAVIVCQLNRTELPYLLPQIPTITVEKGVITSPLEQPVVIRSRDQDVLATIDIAKDQTELTKENGLILVGKDFLLTRQNDNDVRRIPFKDIGNGSLVISPQTVQHMMAQIPYLSMLFVPFLTLGQWLMLVTLTILAACLSYVVTAYMPEEYSFETRMRIGAIAITPPLVVNKILQLTTSYHLGFWIILALWVLHLYVIVIATRHYLKAHTFDNA